MLDEVRDWQGRPLDRMYPIVIFDALRVKIRDDAAWSGTKRSTWPSGVPGRRLEAMLGLWIAENEGAKFWLR